MNERCPPVPQDIKALAWKAQLRLDKTYRRLTTRGKRSVVAMAPVARGCSGSSGRSANASHLAPQHDTLGTVEGALEQTLPALDRYPL
jgi:hypothetical protein